MIITISFSSHQSLLKEISKNVTETGRIYMLQAFHSKSVKETKDKAIFADNINN